MNTLFTPKQKALLIIGALIAIFIGPMIGAWSLYTSQKTPLHTVNYGELLQPPLALNTLKLMDTDQDPFPNDFLQGHWLLFYVSPATCDKLCEQNLYKMRQIRLAEGKDQERIQRFLITSPNDVSPQLDTLIEQEYTGTFHAVMTHTQLNTVFRNFQKGGLFLADPLGNIILYYPPNADPKKIFKDLTRLLRVSQIG